MRKSYNQLAPAIYIRYEIQVNIIESENIAATEHIIKR